MNFRISICLSFAILLFATGFATAAGQSADQLYNEALAADQKGDFARAALLYEEVIKVQPDSIPARTNLGAVLVQLGRFQEAIAQYEEAIKRDPKNSIVHLDLARSEERR